MEDWELLVYTAAYVSRDLRREVLRLPAEYRQVSLIPLADKRVWCIQVN